MCALAFPDAAIAKGLRLAFGSSPLALPPEANIRCRAASQAEDPAGVTCCGDERYDDDRTAAPEARR